MRKEKSKKKKLILIAVILSFIIVIAAAVIYVNLNSTLSAALINSANTFRLIEAGYPLTGPDFVDTNFTFQIENPTGFAVTIERVAVSFSVGASELGGVSVSTSQTLNPRENSTFSFVRHITDKHAMSEIHNQTYLLKYKGQIELTSRYLLVQASWKKNLASTQIVAGIAQVKS
ncbi:MAG: hypothetical protein JSV64_03760 [Candidatus Bathyarchaeota archaeon]|nr:MAG: hypothetical protein JSV64_03760 [Candidatus Bathyarchaeota archaeon]